MSSNGAPPTKKQRSNTAEQGCVGWWKCVTCLRHAVCPDHVGDVLCCAGDAGRVELQNRLKAAQADVKKAERKAANLQRALKRMDDAATSPTLSISHAGWTEGGNGWSAGCLLVTLALSGASLDPPLAAAVCGALNGVTLELEGCSSGLFYAREVALPEQLLELLPSRPRHEMRPGAVLFDPARQRLFVYIRRTPKHLKDVGCCKLLGYLLPEGLQSLSFDHVPNARTFTDCVYCCRTDNVAIPFTKVKVQSATKVRGDKSAGKDIRKASASKKTEKSPIEEPSK